MLLDRWLPITAVDPSTNPNLVHGMPRLKSYLGWTSRRLAPPQRASTPGSAPTTGERAAAWIAPPDDATRGDLLGAANVAARRAGREVTVTVGGLDRAEEAIAAARDTGLLILPEADQVLADGEDVAALLRRARAEGWRLMLLSLGADSDGESGDLVERTLTRLAALPGPSGPRPVPPDALRRRVAVGSDETVFRSGQMHFEAYEGCLARAGVALADCDAILDWGAGCGRLTTRLAAAAPQASITAADTDAEAIAWVGENLEVDAARALPLSPPTALATDAFDLVVGHSVFSHLETPAQDLWLEELARVTRPGGHLAVSIHGPVALRWHVNHPLVDVPPSVADEVARMGIGIWRGDGWDEEFYEGYHTTFHSHDYVREHWSRWLEVLEIHEAAALPHQDIVVLRSPPA